MRDLLLTGLLLTLLPFIIRWPHLGAIAFAWLSLMNPQRLTFGFAYGFPFAQLIMVVTMVGLVIGRERKLPPLTLLSSLLLLFTAWFTLTSYTSVVPEHAWLKWNTVIKVMIATFVTITLITTYHRLHLLVWIIAFSIGFYGIKGGFFTILTGGAHRVWGPAQSFIEDNNALALALVMVVPLFYYLASSVQRVWQRWSLYGCMGLTLLAILGTYSRGGMVALLAMAGFLWLKTPYKLLTGLAGALCLIVGLALMPETWIERMGSIRDYQQDGSVNGRFLAWSFAIDQARQHPITGGGFKIFVLNTSSRGANGESSLNAHSIYFEVLGEHGYVGLALFLLLGFMTFRTGSRIIRETQDDPERAWAGRLAAMLQVSLVGYAVGGTFLTLAFFDLYYYFVALMVATSLLVRREVTAPTLLRTGPPTALRPSRAGVAV